MQIVAVFLFSILGLHLFFLLLKQHTNINPFVNYGYTHHWTWNDWVILQNLELFLGQSSKVVLTSPFPLWHTSLLKWYDSHGHSSDPFWSICFKNWRSALLSLLCFTLLSWGALVWDNSWNVLLPKPRTQCGQRHYNCSGLDGLCKPVTLHKTGLYDDCLVWTC